MVNVKIQLCGGMMPAKAHEDDACCDLYAPKEIIVMIGRQIIPLDFKLQLPKDHCAYIRSRSGFSAKGMTVYLSCDEGREHPIRIDADVTTGVVDCGFAGNVGVILNCRGGILESDEWAHKVLDDFFRKNEEAEIKWDGKVIIKKGERIAQMAILPVPEVCFEQVEKIDDSERGEGGFGSTNGEGGAS